MQTMLAVNEDKDKLNCGSEEESRQYVGLWSKGRYELT